MTSPAIAPPDGSRSFVLFLRRVWAVGLRHIYMHTGSWPRLIEMFYWSILSLLIWGFAGLYLMHQQAETAAIGNALIAAVLFLEVFLRVSVNILALFLEEIWSRNLGHLFASPIRFFDYIFGLILTSLARMMVAVIPALGLAYWLFHFSPFVFGWRLAPYTLLLAMSGCWYGLLMISLMLRFGMSAEWLGWMATQILVPLIAPYYPVAILPKVLQLVSRSLPATYVFEDIKAVLAGQGGQPERLWIALALNLAYMLVASMVLRAAYKGARQRGGLLQVGE